MTRAWLEKELDRVFSIYVRTKDADSSGFVKCVTCPRVLRWFMMDCGHFRKRRHLKTRWMEMNCGPQCRDCNGPLQGNDKEFIKYLNHTYGKGTDLRLTQLSHEETHYLDHDLLRMINKFKNGIADEYQR